MSTKWVCPHCGCEITYYGEGNMRCPQCNHYMDEE